MNRIGFTLGLVPVLGLSIAAGFHFRVAASTPTIPQITLLRTPHGGIQPQTELDRDGVLHMIYFKGDASAGDIEYVERQPGARGDRKLRSGETGEPTASGLVHKSLAARQAPFRCCFLDSTIRVRHSSRSAT